MTTFAPSRHNVGGYRLANFNVWQDDAWSRHTRKVQGWLREPPILEDGESPPTAQAIASCLQRFASPDVARMPAPTRVMPNGEGGIIAEWISGPRTMVIEINEDLSVEITILDQGIRLHRETYRQVATNQFFTY